VDRAVLVASGAVTATFIDRVADLCEEHGGRGDDLVQALNNAGVSGFRSGKIEQLRAWFLENGYMSGEEALSDADLLLRLTAKTHRDALELDPAEVETIVARLATGPAGPTGKRS